MHVFFTTITAIAVSISSACSKPEQLKSTPIKQSQNTSTDDLYGPSDSGTHDATVISKYLKKTLSQDNPFLSTCSSLVGNIGFTIDKDFRFNNALFLSGLFNATEKFSKTELDLKLTDLGFEKIKWIENSDKGVFAFIAERDEFAVIHFRGTSNFGGWMQDAKFITRRANGKDPTNLIRLDDGLDLDGWLHAGFYGSYQTVMGEFERKLSNVNKSKPLYFAGHSLGGALTSIAAGRASINGHNVHATYTAGQPRIGDQEFSESLNKVLDGRHYRIIFEDDMVARVPPTRNGAEYFSEIASRFDILAELAETSVEIAGYTHVSKEINLTESLVREGLTPPSVYFDIAFWKDWSSKLNSITELAKSKILKDHHSNNYACSISKLIKRNSSLLD